MKKQFIAFFALCTLVIGVLTAIPAFAAVSIKSGQNCSKIDAKKSIKFKGETYVYTCVKNPRYKPTRLTWTLEECLTSIKDYNDALARVTALGAAATTLDNELLGLSKQLRNMSCKAGI